MKNNMKLLATAAVIATMALAAPASAQEYGHNTRAMGSMSGPYIGAYGGYGWTDADVAGGDDINGGDYGLFAGYEMTGLFESWMHGLSAAVELHYGWSGADDAGAGNTFDKEHELGVSFKPGLAFLATEDSVVKPYGIVGWRRTQFENNIAGTDDDFDGLEVGIGTEVVAMGNFGVRLDYTHVFYGDDGAVDPDEDNIRAGLAYHF
jgi:outer membrane immunogenic protein